jgi:2'-5' RNA ligase
MNDKKRLFLAVTLSVATTRRIADVAARMRAAADKRGLRVAWVAPANLHVTLKFLGWTAAEVVDAVRDRLLLVAGRRKPFEVTARGVGAFPSAGAARILWAGVADPSGALGAIAAEIDAEMAALGYPRETRPFSAHVTVGRVKDGRGAEEVLAPHHATDFGSSSIRELILYESVTKSSGSEYTALARAPLPPAPGRPERQTRGVEEEKESEEPTNGGQHPA